MQSLYQTAIKYINGLKALLYPSTCVCCNKTLGTEERYICMPCMENLPLADLPGPYGNRNLMMKKFKGCEPENGCCYFIYDKKTVYANIIREIKFGHNPGLCIFMGNVFGEHLARSGIFCNVDIIIPVPLHKQRQRVRGYNQAELIASAIGQKLGIPVLSSAMKREKHTRAQSLIHSAVERKKNVQGVFVITDVNALRGKHILIVDDVTTTGETMKSVIYTIRKSCPGTKISLAALSAVEKE